MPLLDGLQAAEKIKHHLPQTFVILNSAYAEFEFAQKAIRCGVDAYSPGRVEAWLEEARGLIASYFRLENPARLELAKHDIEDRKSVV